MEESYSTREIFLRNLMEKDLFHNGVNLGLLAFRVFSDRIENVEKQEIKGFDHLVITSLAKAFFVPVWQKMIASFLFLQGRVKSQSKADVLFFSFANSHTEVLIPVIKEMKKQGETSFQFFRASNGFPDFLNELSRYKNSTGDIPGLLELFYDPALYFDYLVCVFKMFSRLKEIVQSNEIVLDNNSSIKKMLPSLVLYYAPMGYLIFQLAQKKFQGRLAFIFGYDNCPRGRALVYMAEKNKIRTITIQHGIIADPGAYVPFAQNMIVWSALEFEKLVKAGANPSKLHVWGSPLLENQDYDKLVDFDKKNQIVLALFNGIPADQLLNDINLINDAIASTSVDELHLYIKPHPLDVKRIKKLLGSRGKSHGYTLIENVSFTEAIQFCCLGIVYYSSVIVQFLHNGIPVVSLWQSDKMDPTDLNNESAVQKVSSPRQLAHILNSIINRDANFWKEFEKNRSDFLLKHNPVQEISVSRRIMQLIHEPAIS